MKIRFIARLGLAVILIGVASFGVISFRLWPGYISTKIHLALSELYGHGLIGWICVAALQAMIAISGVLPAAVMGVAAGAVYGVWLGFILTAIGTMVGAIVAFFLARSFFRPVIERLLSKKPYMAMLDDSISKDGWRMVCLLRVSPVMPFGIGSYVFGLSSIRFIDYIVGSLAALPALLGYVALGYFAHKGVNEASNHAKPLQWILFSIAAISTVLLITHVGKIFRKVFYQKSEKE